jgi:hypothetical protein
VLLRKKVAFLARAVILSSNWTITLRAECDPIRSLFTARVRFSCGRVAGALNIDEPKSPNYLWEAENLRCNFNEGSTCAPPKLILMGRSINYILMPQHPKLVNGAFSRGIFQDFITKQR